MEKGMRWKRGMKDGEEESQAKMMSRIMRFVVFGYKTEERWKVSVGTVNCAAIISWCFQKGKQRVLRKEKN